MQFEKATWIGVPESEVARCGILEGDMTGRFAYFTCVFNAKEGERRNIVISAAARYRLWCNGRAVASGPCKGSREQQFYDELTLTGLKQGANLLAVQVLYQDVEGVFPHTSARAGIFGVDAPRVGHRLAVEGAGLTTGEADYRCFLDGSFYLKKPKVLEFLGAIQEDIDFGALPEAWKRRASASRTWPQAKALFPAADDGWARVGMRMAVPYDERPIPLLKEEPGAFVSVCRFGACADAEAQGMADGAAAAADDAAVRAAAEATEPSDSYENLAFGGVAGVAAFAPVPEALNIAPGEAPLLLFDAGVHTNAYPRWHFAGGAGRRVEITYAEDLTKDRTGLRAGLTDSIILAEHETVYEPYWFRTFRYAAVRIGAGAAPVTLKKATFHKTGYPLAVQARVTSSAPWVGKVWDLCVRTLENCMMDTYMDCPFYEQMQYPMDTRLQAAFTYAVSGDARLPKKALCDFHRAKQPSGLVPGKAPTGYLQIISTFSLHYIMMLRDYYWQTGDTALLRALRSDVDGILEYFDAHIRREDGLLGHPGFWAFVDWQDAWEENAGEPTALREGGSSLLSLLYGYALLCAAEIMAATGRENLAAEYRARQRRVAAAVEATCWDEARQLYREGPQVPQFSQHTQSWAVLNGLKEGAAARVLLRRTVDEADVLKCSFSTSNEFFRACQKADAYELTDAAMAAWRQLPEAGLTTCPETPHNARSLCHAWSALPLYELVHAMAGFTPAAPGWAAIDIRPQLVGVRDLAGQVVTPQGSIGFSYEDLEGGRRRCTWQIPQGCRCTFVRPDGTREPLSAGTQTVTV